MKFFRITGLLLLYLLLSSKGCDDSVPKSQQQEDASMEVTQDSLLAKFSSEIIPEASLRAFEENAKQKLLDFADYFNIMNDSSLDTSFRNQAARMIKDLFFREDLQLELTLPGQIKTNSFTLDDLLNNKFLSACNKSSLIIDSIRLHDPLHFDKTSGYVGTLSFRQGFKAHSGIDSVYVDPTWKTVTILAARQSKRFGNDTKEVWEVFLGQMKGRKL